jgi:plastocyanin
MKYILTAILVLTIAWVMIGCGKSSPSTAVTSNPASSTVTSGSGSATTSNSIPIYSQPTAVATKLVSIKITNLAFDPQEIKIPVGAKVTWTNNDKETHSVVSDTGVFESPALTQGTWFNYIFEEAGTFQYHCKFHPTMTGTVIVE